MDTSKLNSRQVKEILTNVITKTAEKSVSQGKYDRTILATIQYCMDKTSGQYRIKYQDGFYTAYANDQSFLYSDGSSVFVTVPQSDFNNKLFITGSASNYNGDKVYLTNLEDDQKYKTIGPNILINRAGDNADFHLSSYWCGSAAQEEFIKYYYKKGAHDNFFTINESAFQKMKTSNFFKLGVSFRTELTDDRKVSGDYGIRLEITYQSENHTFDRVYELNTFMMSGAPFNFTQYVPQTAYWNTSEEGKMIEIKSIAGFVRYFPDSSVVKDVSFRDIFVNNITLQSAQQLYDTTNDMYRVQINSPDDSFIFDSLKGSMNLVADLYVYGNPVQDASAGLEYYWGIKDPTVNSINNPHYCEKLGQGWYCFNSSTLKQSKETTIAGLREEGKQTLEPQQTSGYTREDISYITNQKEIQLSKALCRAKETDIICAVVYSGSTYYSDITPITNPEGFYVLIGSVNDQTVHYNGIGYFTIAAGVFRDMGGDTPDGSYTLNSNVTYIWKEYKNGITTSLPILSPPDQILLSCPEWAPEVDGVAKDNETLTDAQVESYLITNSKFRLCLERYEYYKARADYYNNMEVGRRPEQWATYVERCESRRDAIVDGKIDDIYNKFDANYDNELGYYILGPSDVTAEYLEGGAQDYINAKINSISPRDTNPATRPHIYNTLYKLPAANVGTHAMYEVSAVIYDPSTRSSYPVGTATITLVDEMGASLDYVLEITNGLQSFMYDERGLSPTSEHAIQQIPLQPLSFILRSKEGEIIYDSAAPDKYPDIDISDLHPIWRFCDSKYSFIQTNYQKPTDAPAMADDGMPNTPKYAVMAHDYATTHIWELYDESYFYYRLREDFNINFSNSSNIDLEIMYNGSYIFGSTDFTFTKQGDLGTNGTNKSLSIYSSPYNNYKNNVLANAKYCNFDAEYIHEDAAYDSNDRYYGPDARHLSKPYLFATDSYNRLVEDPDPCSLLEGQYVNLYIAQQAINNGEGIAATGSGSLQARWSLNSDDDTTINSAKWSVPEEGWKNIENRLYYYDSNVTLSSSAGASIDISLKRVNDAPVLSYRPAPFNYTHEGTTGTHISNNMVKVEATMIAKTKQGADRDIRTYAYCGLPYYYFNWTYLDPNLSSEHKLMPAYVDPARHIVIVGGFDQIVYSSDGKNPYYNGEPFRFYMFDRDGRDITYDVVSAARNGNATIQWSCSAGIQPYAKGQTQLDSIPTFANLPNEINIGQLCIYNNKYYKCTYNHQKNLSNVVDYGGGSKVTYAAGTFIPAWWDEIDVNTYYQSMSFVPSSTYETLIENDLFNSWIRLYIRYSIYEAEVFLPINVYCNSYESPELNAWDGKSLEMSDDGEYSYLIANKVSAGIKDDQNMFVGITMGQNIRYVGDGTGGLTPQKAVGIFGFGYGTENPSGEAEHRTKQTMFLDAVTGRAAFGTSGATQIVLDPDPERWSRLAGWYFSRNHLYKPVFEASEAAESVKDAKYSSIMSGNELLPNPSLLEKSFGIYAPADQEISDDTIVMWAGDGHITRPDESPGSMSIDEHGKMTASGAVCDAQFLLNYKGQISATDVHLQGNISATSGYFGTPGGHKVIINYTPPEDQDTTYVLYHPDFYVKQGTGGTANAEVMVRGKIFANAGKIGNVAATDGSNEALEIYFDWYPWSMPTETQGWDSSTHQLLTDVGQNVKYLLYHPQFYVTKNHYDPESRQIVNGTEAYFGGKLFTEEGRVGGWVIKSDRLMSVVPDGNPPNPTILYNNGNAQFGNLYLQNTGAINHANDPWWITADGNAYFKNRANEFTASKVDSTKVIVGTTIIESGHGLYLEPGESFTIGTGAAMTANNGSGFQFTGAGCDWTMDHVNFNADVHLGITNKIYVTQTGGLIYLDKTGFHTNGSGGNYDWDSTGGVHAKSLSVGSSRTYYWDQNGDIHAHDIWINNQSIENYIKSVISDVFDGDVVTSVAVSGRASVNDVDDTTRSVITSISVGTKHI